MFGIQFNRNMSRERWEELHNLDIESWGFPLSVENAFLNAGCRNTGEVIDLTENEIKECIELIRSSNSEVVHKEKFEQVMGILQRENEDLLLEQWFLSQMDEIRSAKKTFAIHVQCIEAFLENGLSIYTDASIQDAYMEGSISGLLSYSMISDTEQSRIKHKVSSVLVVIAFPCFMRCRVLAEMPCL